MARNPPEIPPFLRRVKPAREPAPRPEPIYNDDGDALDIGAPELRAYCGQPGTPLAALPCGVRAIQVKRGRKWIRFTCDGRRTKARRTPELDAWLDELLGA